MEESLDDSLITLTRTCARLRSIGSDFYLRRRRILTRQDGRYIVRLKPTATAPTLQLVFCLRLCNTTFLFCDLFLLIKYQQELQNLKVSMPALTSILIEFRDSETYLLKDPRTPIALRAVLGSLPELCESIHIQPYTLGTPPRSLPPLASTINDSAEGGQKLLPTIQNLYLSTLLLSTKDLRNAFSFLMCGTHVRTLELNCSLSSDCRAVLAAMDFPLLTSFSIRSRTTTKLDQGFFIRHAKINTVTLVTTSCRTPSKRPVMVPTIPALHHLYLSSDYQWSFDSPTFRYLYVRPADSFINPTSPMFCTHLAMLSRPVRPNASNLAWFDVQLSLAFPAGLNIHLEQAQRCSCRNIEKAVHGPKRMIISLHESSSLVYVGTSLSLRRF